MDRALVRLSRKGGSGKASASVFKPWPWRGMCCLYMPGCCLSSRSAGGQSCYQTWNSKLPRGKQALKILKWNTHSIGGFSSKPCCRGIKMIKPLTNLTNNFRDNLPTAIGRDFAGYFSWRTGLRECRGEALVETWRHRAAMLTRAKVRKIAMRNGYGMLWHCKIRLENKIIYEIAIDKFNQI